MIWRMMTKTKTTMINKYSSPGGATAWKAFMNELNDIIRKVDDKLDEYGEPNRSPVRKELREIIDYTAKEGRG